MLSRLEKLLAHMEREKLEAFYVSSPENVRYLSGFTGDDSYLFITQKEQYFITDPRYTEQAAAECPTYTLVNWRTPKNTMGDTLQDLMNRTGAANLAFESAKVSYQAYQSIREKVSGELLPTEAVIEGFRALKSPEELECSRISCDIASRAFEKIIQDIRVGITEKELASRLAHYMVMEGADTKPYGGIVISGARTSLLHGIPSSKALEYGDLVLMDYGCQYRGYLSDMTRTVVLGKATQKQREVYELEKQMVEDCEAVLKEGTTGIESYEASIKALQTDRFKEYFEYHYKGIGHGVGMFVHELPFIGANADSILKAGNIITVEPGIYIPGFGGIRIEDQVLITKNGYENLISATKELIEL